LTGGSPHDRPTTAGRWKGMKRMKVSIVWAPLLLTAISGTAVSAQSPEDDPRSGARLHLGPFYLTPTIVLQDMGIDSNVFNTSINKESDFTFALTPSVDGMVGSRRARVTFRSGTDFVYFAKHDSERGVNQDLAGSGVFNLARVTLLVRGTYLNTRGRPNEEIDVRARRVETSGDAAFRLALFGKVAAEAGTRMFRAQYDPDATFNEALLAQTLNRNIRTNYGGLRYALTPLTTIQVSGEAGEERFPLSPIRDSDSAGAYGAVEFDRRAMIHGAARVGYQRFRPLHTAMPPFSGVIGFVDIGYRIRESTQLGVTLDRRPAYSYEPREPYYLGEAIGISVRRQLTATFELDVRLRHLWYEYRRLDTGSALADAPGRVDTWTNLSAALNFQVNRKVTSTFQASHWVRRSDVYSYTNMDGLRIGTTMFFRF
jgi:hypothetical protein